MWKCQRIEIRQFLLAITCLKKKGCIPTFSENPYFLSAFFSKNRCFLWFLTGPSRWRSPLVTYGVAVVAWSVSEAKCGGDAGGRFPGGSFSASLGEYSKKPKGLKCRNLRGNFLATNCKRTKFEVEVLLYINSPFTTMCFLFLIFWISKLLSHLNMEAFCD